jgi:hypothetical protein
MTLCNFAHGKGMTLNQYITLKDNISATAAAIVETIKQDHPERIDTGIYYDVADILTPSDDGEQGELLPYIIQALKKLGMEFTENNTLWRI